MQPFERMTLYLFLGTIVLIYSMEIFVLLKSIFLKILGKKRKSDKKTYLLHGVGLFGALCFVYGYAVEPYWIELTKIPIKTDKLHQTSLRIIQFSDTHCDRKSRNEHKVVEHINSLHPDIIVFTGDTLNTHLAMSNFRNMMRNLEAPLGKYAVMGNWDVWQWNKTNLYRDTEFTVLDHDKVVLTKDDETFTITGLNCAYPDRAKVVLSNISKRQFNIFLYHNPDLIESITDRPVDLYLAGHTHGGQVALPFYGALVTLSKFGKKYESGKYRVGETILYVTRGIGMEGGPVPRVRFLARPEITIFDISPSTQ